MARASLAALAFAALSFFAGWAVYVLTVNLEVQPEPPAAMTGVLRLVGGVIAACCGVFGFVFLGYAVVLSLG